MISNNLKSSRLHLAALSLPVMGREEMHRVPRFPGPIADAFRDQLNAIIDSNLFARDDDAASQARDLLETLPRVPIDGHELYSAGAGEVDQAFVGTVYQAPSGQWSFRIDTPEGPHCAGGGFDTDDDAQTEMWSILGGLNHGEELADFEADGSEAGSEARAVDAADAGGNQEDAGGAAGVGLNDVLVAVLPAQLFNAMMGNCS